MDKRTLRARKGKSRNARPYDRQNQSIFGKVCSTVKGLLNPSSWFNVSHWINNSDEQHGCTSDDIEEGENIDSGGDIVSQSVSNTSKRLRLRLDGHNFQDGPSIQSSETQTWPEQPPQNIYETIPCVSPPSSTTTNSLLENKEVLAVINGDDHSENSEGSASTSGCSSLISSHKESNRLAERPFVSSRKRKDTSPKSDYNDFNCRRGLWSSSFNPSLKFQRRYPTVSHTNQPNFNLSSFAGPSRLNESSDKKVSSPFYDGKTTFGGASASRRMPASVVPYQVDRSLRNQIRVREQNPEDNLKRMSSAAERILLTLDKISSPVSDAKRIPSLDTSPVDLSVYLTPPKSRWNSQLTPSIASKGPPIANINTIAKLATLKNYGTSRLRNTPQSESTSAEQHSSSFDIIQPNIPEIISQKSGGGKMKNKLNQHHISSKGGHAESEVMDIPALKSIPLPITSLPTINFGPKPDKTLNSHFSASGFTFSKPIEHDLSVSNTLPASTLALPSPYSSFKFASPIDYDLPNNSQPKENSPSPTWECSACWVRNPHSKTSCLACETPRETKETKNKVNCLTNNNTLSTWECPSCWVRNPMKEKKCMACETLHPNADVNSAVKDDSSFKFNSPLPTSPITFKFGNYVCTAPSTVTTSTFKYGISVTESQPATSASGFKFDTSNVTKSSFVSPVISETVSKASETSPVNSKSKEVTTASNSHPVTVKTEDNKSIMSSTTSSVTTTSPFVFGSSVNTSAPSTTASTTTTSGFTFGASNPSGEVNCLTNNNTLSTWECTSCWVRNPMKEKKCMACETLHPNADVNSAVKDGSSFKFNSPLQQSPITFKFGNYVCTAPSTATTSTFKYGISVTESQPATSASGFKFDTSNVTKSFVSPVISETVSKASETSPVDSKSIEVTTASNSHPVTNKIEDNKAIILSATSSVTTTSPFVFGSSVNTSAPSAFSFFPTSSSSSIPVTTASTTTTSAISKTSETSPVNSKNNEVTTESNSHPVTNKTEDNKAITSSATSSVTTTSPFVFGSSVNTSAPSAFSFFPTSQSSSTPSTTASTTTTSGFTFGASNPPGAVKDGSSFKFNSTLQNPPIPFKFGNYVCTVPPTVTTSTFKFGISVTEPQTTTSASGFKFVTSKASSFVSPVISETVSKTSEIAPVNSKSNEVTTASNSHPVTIKTEDNKTIISSAISSVTTTSPFVFGSSVNSSAPSAFSFFPTSSSSTPATTASTTTSSVFTFGASNPSGVPQPSGISFGLPSSFTFNNRNDNSDATTQKPALPFGSTIPAFGNTPAQPSFDGSDKPSGGFNFGTSSTVFQFGAASNNTDKKRSATASGFSFGTPTAPETNASSFPSGFSINTPPSFNFGAASTPAGPFQFAASGAAKPASTLNSGPRKIRKAVRRVPRGKD